jgi:ribosomal protein S18 acetylase RimI-like enzyme
VAVIANIRKVVPGDRARLVSMIERCDNLTDAEKICAGELLDIYLKLPNQADYSFLTVTDGADSPAGYVCYGKRPLADAVYDLYWIIVDPAHRGKGLASAMLKRLEEIVIAEGARILVAETSGQASYGAARGLYGTRGFIEEARINGFYRPGDDLVVYVRRF